MERIRHGENLLPLRESVSQSTLTQVYTITHTHTHSHLVTALPGPLLSEVILSSPILAGEDGVPLASAGQGFEFGIDPAEDPELAMVVRYANIETFECPLTLTPCFT